MTHDGKSKVALEPRTDGADRDRAENESGSVGGAGGGSGLLAPLARIHEQYENLCPDGPASADTTFLGRWLESLGVTVEADAAAMCADAQQGIGPLGSFDTFYDW